MPSLKSLFLPAMLILASPLAVQGQIEDLTRDMDFFQNQKAAYQRWLDHAGLGATLRVYELDVKPQRISLYLAFAYQDIDSVIVAWTQLKAAFEKTRPLSLEQELFYKMTQMMEVRQSLADVQIYDTYDLRKEPLFSRAIYFEDGRVQVQESNPKSKIREIAIRPASFAKMKKMTQENIRQEYDRKAVYDKIYEYAQKRYEKKVCEQRYPKVLLLESDESLRFEVEDLCREVLTHEANPALCGILSAIGYDCNWVKRELLTFTIVYKESSDGFRLSIEIDGKYGSGFYSNVRRGGYLNMEIDFDSYLERYADKFKEEIKRLFP
jgi:hypothetical protein